MRRLFFYVLLIAFALPGFGQVTTSSDILNFFTVYTDSPDSMSFTLTNNNPEPYVVSDIITYHDAFSASETSFTIAPGGTKTVWVTCAPIHNLKFADFLYVKSSSHPQTVSVFLYAFVKYRDTYWDITQDKWHEDLKGALSTLLSFGTTELGYNLARDSVFMRLDNEKVNGGGASQNTLECVYTGQTAVGYLNRSDAQNNYNFNTEHTFPQSLFSQNWPMVADMHHLFAVSASSNSERSNKPFGVVTSPNWSVGGSKSNGSTFEPRDAHKGAAARSLLYFVLRYQDYSGFVAGQETILRQWAANFPPTAAEERRNESIYRMQGNLSPFVSHPEFLDRITRVTANSPMPTAPEAWVSNDTLYFTDVPAGATATGNFYISDQGWSLMSVSNFQTSDPAFTLGSNLPTEVKLDSAKQIVVNFSPTVPNITYNEDVSFETNDPTQPTVVVHLVGTSIASSTEQAFEGKGPALFPNPADERMFIERNEFPGDVRVHIIDGAGKIVHRTTWQHNQASLEIRTSEMPAGIYQIHLSGKEYSWNDRFVVTH